MEKLNFTKEEANAITTELEAVGVNIEKLDAFNNLTLDFLEDTLTNIKKQDAEPLLALNEVCRSINNYLILNYTARDTIIETNKQVEDVLTKIYKNNSDAGTTEEDIKIDAKKTSIADNIQ